MEATAKKKPGSEAVSKPDGAPGGTPSTPSSPISKPSSTSQGLAFLALLSFVVSFLSARIFATRNPDEVVVTGGIHLHHFWYGLAIIVVVGWLGIIHNNPVYSRLYAILFGLGCGLIGDEVGLLLTFGDYNSSLTSFFFLIAVAGASMVILLTRRRKYLGYDVFSLGYGERVVYAGVMVAGLSALAFAAGYLLFGVLVVAAGVGIAVFGLWLRGREGRVAALRQKTAAVTLPP